MVFQDWLYRADVSFATTTRLALGVVSPEDAFPVERGYNNCSGWILLGIVYRLQRLRYSVRRSRQDVQFNENLD